MIGHDVRPCTPDSRVRRPRTRLASRAGFSLVELIVAMLILAVGLLGLAAGTGFVVRSSELGRVETERAQARQSAVELIRAQDFDTFADGDRELGRYEISWETLSSETNTRLVQITIVGPGRGATGPEDGVSESFEYRVNSRGGS